MQEETTMYFTFILIQTPAKWHEQYLDCISKMAAISQVQEMKFQAIICPSPLRRSKDEEALCLPLVFSVVPHQMYYFHLRASSFIRWFHQWSIHGWLVNLPEKFPSSPCRNGVASAKSQSADSLVNRPFLAPFVSVCCFFRLAGSVRICVLLFPACRCCHGALSGDVCGCRFPSWRCCHGLLLCPSSI